MLITGKKRPFCFVLKQESGEKRGKTGLFHNEMVVRKAAGCVILSGEPQARSRRIQTNIGVGGGGIPLVRTLLLSTLSSGDTPQHPGLSAKKITPGESPAYFVDWNVIV